MTSESPRATSKSKQAILDAAVSLFSENGYTGTTMRDIADAVGVLPGSLYAHIKGKEELLIEIVESGIARFLTIETLIKGLSGSAESKLRAAITGHIKIVAEGPEKTLVVFHQWRFLTEPNLSIAIAMRRRYAQMFTDILNEGVKSGEFSGELDSRVEVFTILGALNWAPEWYVPDGKYSPEVIGEKIADTLLSGLQARQHRVKRKALVGR